MSSNQERNPESEGRGLTSTHATVLAALFAMVSAIAGAAVSAYFTLETESTKSIALRDIEKAKQEAATKLARQEFETRLIFRAIEGSASHEERTRNLLFFLKAGFLTDPDGKIASLKPDQYPSKPAMDVVVTESDLESDITDVRRRARRTLAVPEAIPQITRLLANNRIHP